MGNSASVKDFLPGKVDIVTINDPFIDLNYMICITLSMSSLTAQSRLRKGNLVINKKTISIFQDQNPTNIKWDGDSAKYAVKSTHVFTTMEKARTHLKDGAKRFFISTPSVDIPIFVMGVNHEKYDSPNKILAKLPLLSTT
ncbi:glyceraldehyde-3-phosphate dehydrogenase-like [Sigmodon hispidus]